MSVAYVLGDGYTPHPNLAREMESQFKEIGRRLRDNGIDVWGWHVPSSATRDIAQKEARLIASLAEQFRLAGVLVDAESGSCYFRGDAEIVAVIFDDAEADVVMQNNHVNGGIGFYGVPSKDFTTNNLFSKRYVENELTKAQQKTLGLKKEDICLFVRQKFPSI